MANNVHFINKSSLLIVLSESWKEFYVESMGLPESRVMVFPNAIELPREVPIKQDSPINVLFAGRIGERKGAFDLISAWSRLSPEAKSQAILHITGDGKVEEARRLADELNISDSAQIHGWIKSDELVSLFSSSSIYILPSRNALE